MAARRRNSMSARARARVRPCALPGAPPLPLRGEGGRVVESRREIVVVGCVRL